LADRINIARSSNNDEPTTISSGNGGGGSSITHTTPINLSIQYILNCAGSTAGSCYGGSHTGVYEFIQSSSNSRGFGVPYDSCMPYIACSADSAEGFCGQVDTTCSAINTCRTCDHSGMCQAIEQFPNATVAEYGTYSYLKDGFGAVADKIKVIVRIGAQCVDEFVLIES
jgi:hypothetical protein